MRSSTPSPLHPTTRWSILGRKTTRSPGSSGSCDLGARQASNRAASDNRASDCSSSHPQAVAMEVPPSHTGAMSRRWVRREMTVEAFPWRGDGRSNEHRTHLRAELRERGGVKPLELFFDLVF